MLRREWRSEVLMQVERLIRAVGECWCRLWIVKWDHAGRPRMRPHNFTTYGQPRAAKTQDSTALLHFLLIRKRSEVQVLAGPPHETAGQAGSEDPAPCFRPALRVPRGSNRAAAGALARVRPVEVPVPCRRCAATWPGRWCRRRS